MKDEIRYDLTVLSGKGKKLQRNLLEQCIKI